MTFVHVLRDAGALLRRDGTVILALGGALVFWPTWAVLLLVPRPPDLPTELLDGAAMATWRAAVLDWGGANAGWYLAAEALALLGLAALAGWYARPDRSTVGGALAAAARRYPRVLLVSLAAALAVGIGLRLLILPGLYLQMRLAAALPALMAAPRRGARHALVAAWRASGRAQLALTGAVVALFVVQLLAAAALLPLDTWLRTPGRENALVLALADAGLAAVLAGYRVAVTLIGIGIWRRYASSGI